MDKLRRVLSGREDNEEAGLTTQVRVFICSVYLQSLFDRPSGVYEVTLL